MMEIDGEIFRDPIEELRYNRELSFIKIKESALKSKRSLLETAPIEAAILMGNVIEMMTEVQISCARLSPILPSAFEAGGIVVTVNDRVNESESEMVIPITNDSIIDMTIKETK